MHNLIADSLKNLVEWLLPTLTALTALAALTRFLDLAALQCSLHLLWVLGTFPTST
jgi:hypothetical protein